MNNKCCVKKKDENNFNSISNNILGPRKEYIGKKCINNNDTEYFDISLFDEVTIYTKYKDCEYLVIKKNDVKSIYIYSKELDEIGKININFNKDELNGIVYDQGNNKILLSTSNNIFSISTTGEYIKNELNNYSKNKIKTSTCLCQKKIINNNNKCCNNINFNNNVCINTIGIIDGNVIIAYEQEGSTFIAKLTMNGNIVSEIYLDDNIKVDKIFGKKNQLIVIGNIDCRYRYKYIYQFINNRCNNHYNYCEIVLDDECRIDIECLDIPCDKNQCKCEVINSIALIEKCIAKVICYESEKIKKVIDSNCSNCELIQVNNSVCKTIEKITYLEQILKEKLELILIND